MGPYVDATLQLQSVEYINASPIDNLGDGAMPFIATMCPKRETFAHFWSMVRPPAPCPATSSHRSLFVAAFTAARLLLVAESSWWRPAPPQVWELNSRVIINLTHERDRVGSGPSDKRERYWPPVTADRAERQTRRAATDVPPSHRHATQPPTCRPAPLLLTCGLRETVAGSSTSPESVR